MPGRPLSMRWATAFSVLPPGTQTSSRKTRTGFLLSLETSGGLGAHATRLGCRNQGFDQVVENKDYERKTYPEIDAATSSSDSSGSTLTAGETTLSTEATTSTLRPAASALGKRAVAPSQRVTGRLGMDRTIGVPGGSQDCSWATEMPGHMVTTVGRASPSSVPSAPAISRHTCGTSPGRVQMKTTWELLPPPSADAFQMLGCRLFVVARALGYSCVSCSACSVLRAVTAMAHVSSHSVSDE
ncbi:hypothetical protein PgNI_05485 [Pyricularia grisea]|uniref:Uncharacterized protein n=1 Tax=Pyricularia grisea TaxID=148305 RepID=A0A6P8B602_PYRGI|nr:hypothetical protein PgNI_05485 [Pyricularia grisea]TLD10737.1 hypothetical protein PgNI_05485 [Pyricularia grisea]